MIKLNHRHIAGLVFILGPSFTHGDVSHEDADQVTVKIAIIGGGPAAFAAAISAGNGKLDPIVVEGYEPGGQTVKAGEIKNFPGYKSINGAELVSNMKEHAEHLGAKIIDAQVTKVDLSKQPFTLWTDKKETILAHTVIIATGSEPIKLNCPGEDKCWGKGVVVCAKCDGHLFKDKSVVIVGGGYSALRELGNLKLHTNKITIVNPDTKFSGPQFLINQTTGPGITILQNHSVNRILEKDGYVTGVEVTNKSTGQTTTLSAQGVLIGLGWKPSSKLFDGQLKLNTQDQIIVTGDANTSVPGVYAAGDVTSKSRHQLIMATSSGFAAAMDAETYLREKNLL